MALDTPLSANIQDKLKQAREQIDATLEALVAEVSGQAAADRDAVAAAAQAEVDAAVEKARAEAEAGLAERLAAAEQKLRAESEAALAERVAAVQSQAQAAEAARDASDAATRSLHERLAAMEALAAKTAADAEQQSRQLTAEREEAERRLAEAQARAGTGANGARAEERDSDLACLERLVDAIRDLDAAASLSQVLDKLAEHAATQVARVAILVVREGELRGWRLAGFGDAEPNSVTVPLDAPGVLRHAVDTRARAITGTGDTDARLEPPSFAGLPADRAGLALPLTVGTRTVAVVYGDEGVSGERIVPSGWPEALELLSRHAACRLELLTLARAQGLHAQQQENGRLISPDAAAGAPQASPRHSPPPGGRPPSMAIESPVDAGRADDLRRIAEEDQSALRYARLLISEIKLYHEEAVNEGRREANLLTRLGPEIAKARRLYEERIPADVRSRADHFGTELVRTLANGDPRLLGQTT